jgi:hypothetical protein
MSLKQSVVIVNEFTTKTPKGGTRGGTPGDYVLRYMARDGATEDLTPIRMDTENFIMRYMARQDAVDVAESVSELKKDMKDIQGDGGIAFGYGEFSLSHKKLKAASKDIQKNFDNGKTVMKTVLSFDEGYLRQHGIIHPDFELESEGDYRGNIDQMKLRLAIMNGMDKLGRYYDDLQYIGVIQVDTKHVHCHLAMVDRGRGTIMPDGTQKGKISDKQKQAIRRGIDTYLDEAQNVKMMSANVEKDRRNTLCFIKRYTHQAMDERGFSQFLLACLPEDRNLWRAGTNRKEMQKPNAIVREYVKSLLDQPDSGYKEALQKVDNYAKRRTQNEGLSGQEYRKLYKVGQERIITDGMNCVYSVLKQIPESEMQMRTPMLETMALPYEDMADEADTDSMIEFGFKLRSYKSRLDYHKKERHKYHEAVKDYEKREEAGNADTASKPLYDFLKEEEEYNAKLMAKYQYFLKFIPSDDEYQQGFDELMAYDKRITNLTRMSRDSSMKRMKPENAETYGLQVYNEEGGQYVVKMPQVLDNRLAKMRKRYEEMRDEYVLKLSDYGMTLDSENQIQNDLPYEFDDVKALDVHHLMYDFPYDFQISTVNIDNFVEATDERYDKFQRAKQYLINSGQEEAISSFAVDDIELQKSVADRFRDDAVLHTKRDTSPERRKATKTVRIDYDFYVHQEEEIKETIKDSMNTIQYEYGE